MTEREFWRSTFAGCLVRVNSYYLNMGYRSSDFRALFTLTYNVNAKHKKNPGQLWPLNIDTEFKKQYTHEEIKARNDRIRKMMKQKHEK